MQLDLYQIDAFTNNLFGGNPACIVPLTHWLPDELLMKITRENAVAETAFFILRDDKVELRWFTPEIEMDLCGHATLAASHVLKDILGYTKNQITFSTASGDLKVTAKDRLYTMDFPSRKPQLAQLPQIIQDSLSQQPVSVLKSRDYLLIYEQEADVKDIRIDRQLFDQINLDPGGVIVTAPGNHCDFVSRFFTPQASILEDPVTGSAHCSLIPYWAEQLNKDEMLAFQLSDRMGKLICHNKEDRVLISGHARTYSSGVIFTE